MQKGQKGIISFGFNHSVPNSVTGSIHAENHAISKLKNRQTKNNLKKIDILIIKTSKTGSHLGNSRPCIKCMNDLVNLPSQKGYKIKNVYYSCTDGSIKKEHLNKLSQDENQYITKFYADPKHCLKNLTCCTCATEETSEEEDSTG